MTTKIPGAAAPICMVRKPADDPASLPPFSAQRKEVPKHSMCFMA